MEAVVKDMLSLHTAKIGHGIGHESLEVRIAESVLEN